MVHLQLERLKKSFAGHTVLAGIDLEIHAGELFFLLGPSGCGKTTLLRHIAGFYQPDEGRMLFNGKDVSRVPAHQRYTGMMFQSYALWPHLNVAENVGFGLVERKVPAAERRQRVAEALDLVQLSGMGERRIQQLSGGQQQRVAMARALVIRPQVFLLDEPLSNLDTKLRMEMRAEIRRLCKQFGLTGVYVTHDQQEALSMGDRLAIMHEGHIVQVDVPMQVYRRPKNAMAAAFMGETHLLPGTLIDSSAAALRIQTELGTFTAAPGEESFAQGEGVLLSIRPEALRLSPAAEAQHSFTALITGAQYLGAEVHYQLQAGGVVLKAMELNPPLLRPIGSELTLHVVSEDVIVLRK
jgi:iron(III) transport system ATP-binding protein